MEVLGAVAAAGQLLGTAMKLINSIAQLKDNLQHAPARCREWTTELAVLDGTLTDICQNTRLQASHQIVRVMDVMTPKIDNLTNLCSCYIPNPKQNLIIRLNKAISARSLESKILQNFESLEHDKSTLLLTISTLKGLNSTSIEQFPRTMDKTEEQRQCEDTNSIDSSPSINLPDLEILPKNSQVMERSQPHSAAITTQDLMADNTNVTQLLALLEQFAKFQANNSPMNLFKNIKLKGNNCIFGTSRDACCHFDGAEVIGNGRLDGSHSEDVTKAYIDKFGASCKNQDIKDTSKTDPEEESLDEYQK
ncbi:hypothetical protein F4806DRAFT_466719 [Annulohypoxylon nitens]|nr:hypothetical protein F4806DRAFT_466719 [Annulohypoxylon nitens]